MKEDTPAGLESTGTDVGQLSEQQIREVVRSEVGQLVEVRSDSEKPGLTDVWIAGQPLGKIIESNRETAKSAEKMARKARSSEDKPQGSDGENGSQDSDMLPIERLARLKESDDDPEDNPFADTTESVDRAVAIFSHFEEWSSKAPSGNVIRDNLKNLLSTATGESLAWKQCYRAARKLEEWSKGAIQFRKTRRHGWILVEEQSSSAATG